MSGIFGVFNRNVKSVDKEIVNGMFDAMSYWSPDEHDVWIGRAVVLGHTMLWNTPESKYEHLPLSHEAYVLTMDARIDNRDELVKDLELPDRSLEEIGDSEFVLAAYKKWGEDCPKYLLGDFAFAIWDEKKQQLFCARDHIGIKSFYFYLDDDKFVFSNDIKGILAHPNVPKQFDDNTVAMYMQDDGIHTKKETFFENIKKLPAATTLVISANKVVEKNYWRIEDSPAISFNRHEEYAIKLRELLDSAVKVRLRTIFPVASHLSGGIDSSSITVLAARMLKSRAQKLHVFNWLNIPHNSEEYEFESWNFSRKIATVEKNIDHHEFSIDPKYMVYQYKNHNIFTKGTMYYWREYYIQNIVQSLDARTILSGWGGDELISYSGYSYIGGLFRQGKVLQAFSYLLNEKKYMQYSWKKLAKQTLLQILPLQIIKFLRKKNQNSLRESKNCIYVTKQFSEFLKTYKEKEFTETIGVRNNQIALYNSGHILNRIESWGLTAFSNKIEYSYPLLDKRIVEFAVGIPEEIFYPREGQNRHLIRNAVSDLLPSDILWFIKANETKVNQTFKLQYTEALKILKKDIQKMDCNRYLQHYIDCKKMKKVIESFDFSKEDSYELGNIVTAFMFLRSMKNLFEQ